MKTFDDYFYGDGRALRNIFFTACNAKGLHLAFSEKDIHNLRIARDAASAGRERLLSSLLARSMFWQPQPARRPRQPFEYLMGKLAGQHGNVVQDSHDGIGV